MSLRKLKFHEQKLLRKVDFVEWKSDQNVREIKVLRRYHVLRREDYVHYNRLVGEIRRVAHRLKALDPKDPYRVRTTEQLVEKLYAMGILTTKRSLAAAEAVPASAFCRRRLPVVMARLKMAETLREATAFVEQGHVRVGPEVVTDPAFLVTRSMEDHVQWVDSSKIRRTIQAYHDKLDDYELLGN